MEGCVEIIIYTILILVILVITIIVNLVNTVIRYLSVNNNDDITEIEVTQHDLDSSYTMAIDEDGNLHIWGKGINNNE